jgi:hypothetical protein
MMAGKTVFSARVIFPAEPIENLWVPPVTRPSANYISDESISAPWTVAVEIAGQ